MKEHDLELARLENERARPAQEIASHERQGRQMAWIALPLATIVVIFIAAAIVGGQLSSEGLLWITLLGGLIAYLLTREIRMDGKSVFVFEVLMMLDGQIILARDHIQAVRKRLAACEARIAELKGSS
jgi:hypothetical protein